jgi:hypothetical protein
VDLRNRLPPRLVTFPQLVAKLYPYVQGYKWGIETIHDLWIKGAPMPEDRCPNNRPCNKFPECDHIRRVILPNYFAEWWTDVGGRLGSEMSPQDVLRQIK